MGKIITHNITERSFVARCIGTEEELKEGFNLMIENRLAPINLNGYFMRYRAQQIIDSPVYEQMLKQRGIIDNIVSLKDADSAILDVFVKENPFQEYFLISDKVDRDATCVFIHSGIVVAIIYACIYDNNDVYAPTCYLHPQSKYELAIPFLIVSMMERARHMLGELNDIYLCPSYKIGRNGIEKLFGKPQYSIGVQDYSIIYRNVEDGERIKQQFDTYNKGSVREDVLFDYLEKDEFAWVSYAAALRIPYVVDLRKLSESLLKDYRSEVVEWIKKWDLDRSIWKNIVFRCGKTKDTINAVLMEDLQNESCRKIYRQFLLERKIPQFDKIQVKPEDVTIRLFSNERDDLYDFMPEHIRKALRDKEMIVMGALTPKNEIIGIAVLDVGGVKEDIAYFKYSYVIREYEDKGIYDKFMAYSVMLAKRIGCTCMYTKSMCDQNGRCRYDINELAKGYVDIKDEDESVIMVYRLEQFVDIDMNIVGEGYKDIKIVTSKDVNENQLKILQKRAWEEKGVYFNIENYDENYTFFVDDFTTLNAAVFATQLSDSELILRDIYISSKYKKKDAAIALITGVLKKARMDMDMNALVLIKTDNQTNVEELKKIIGEPEEIIFEKEFFGEFTEKESEEDSQKLYMPDDVGIERAFCEKIELMIEIYKGRQNIGMLCSLLLDQCSDYPGNEICKYIRDNYLKSR